MIKIFRQFVLIGFIVAVTSCSNMPMDHDNPSYGSLLNTYSDRAQYYEGFSNVFQIQATFLNERVSKAQNEIKNESFKWTDAQRSSESTKLQESLRSETLVFLSFYTVDPKLDDLDRGQTVWRIFLDVDNKRYSGVIKKSLSQFSETMVFYPYHNRFASAYYVKFPVPMVNIQNSPAKLTVTGTVGSLSIQFPAMK